MVNMHCMNSHDYARLTEYLQEGTVGLVQCYAVTLQSLPRVPDTLSGTYLRQNT